MKSQNVETTNTIASAPVSADSKNEGSSNATLSASQKTDGASMKSAQGRGAAGGSSGGTGSASTPRSQHFSFKPPFHCSELKVGLHVLQGIWYNVLDADNKLVCTVPANRKTKEKEEDWACRVDQHIAALLATLNRE